MGSKKNLGLKKCLSKIKFGSKMNLGFENFFGSTEIFGLSWPSYINNHILTGYTFVKSFRPLIRTIPVGLGSVRLEGVGKHMVIISVQLKLQLPTGTELGKILL